MVVSEKTEFLNKKLECRCVQHEYYIGYVQNSTIQFSFLKNSFCNLCKQMINVDLNVIRKQQ